MSGDGQWTSVSMPYVSGKPGDAWAAEAKAQGGKGTQRLVTVGTRPASEAVATALRLPVGELVVLRSRVMLLDDRPVELVDSYYPASIAGGTRLAETSKIPGGAVAHLASLGHAPRRVVEDVTARLATPTEAEAFGLELPVAVIELARVLFSDDDQPVEASVMLSPADARTLRYEMSL